MRGYAQGDHICTLFATPAEHLAVAAAYVADGLHRGEQCLYATGSNAGLMQFRRALQREGIDVPAALKRNALLLLTSAEAHLAGGAFDSERMLKLLNDAVETALNSGFKGLRTCGDMSWLLEEVAGSEQVLEYEALLNQFFQGVRGMGMCLYDRARLPAALLDHALATHASVVVDRRHLDNRFGEPAVAMSRAPEGDRLAWKISELQRCAQG